MTLSERSGLIPNEQEHDPTNARSRTTSNKYAIYLASGLLAAAVLYFYSDLRIWNAGRTKNLKNFGSMVRESSLRASATNTEIDTRPGVVYLPDIPLEGKKKKKNKEEQHSNEKKLESHAEPVQRCEWVVDIFTRKYAGRSREELCTQYAVQAADPNVFYRATAEIFWRDFKINSWGKRIDFETIGVEAVNTDGTPLQPYSTWTWITGDQHLSNFGAWSNRHHDVVFSVNDFDEAAIYDFGVDVLRIATSVCNHAHSNGLNNDEINAVLRAFTDTYVETLIHYVGGDRELLYELTPQTATGSLKTFLTSLETEESSKKQLKRFTDVDKKTGRRSFIKDDSTRLVQVSQEVEEKIREQFTITKYGATMMKVGWHTYSWSEFFEVLDIAGRVGSGVGSFGVERYYILLNGVDGSLGEEGVDGSAVILDVKMEPDGAVRHVLSDDEKAWYDIMFANDAARAVEAQRHLTSYVDPFTGWITLDGQAFVVRQRSPWKSSPDLDELKEPAEFITFMEQVAIATATSHARGTLAKSPGQFKHVIASVLSHWTDRTIWGKAVAEVANDYRKQVLLDFACFRDYVDRKSVV